MTIRNKNSSGDDGISAKIFQNLPDSALTVLSEAINHSWISGTFPSELKTAKVIPLFKGGDPESLSNYRPISLLSTLSKIIEKLAKSRIISFLERYNILNQNQFGFQNNKSTNDAMFSFLEGIYEGMNRGGALRQCSVIYRRRLIVSIAEYFC